MEHAASSRQRQLRRETSSSWIQPSTSGLCVRDASSASQRSKASRCPTIRREALNVTAFGAPSRSLRIMDCTPTTRAPRYTVGIPVASRRGALMWTADTFSHTCVHTCTCACRYLRNFVVTGTRQCPITVIDMPQYSWPSVNTSFNYALPERAHRPWIANQKHDDKSPQPVQLSWLHVNCIGLKLFFPCLRALCKGTPCTSTLVGKAKLAAQGLPKRAPLCKTPEKGKKKPRKKRTL